MSEALFVDATLAVPGRLASLGKGASMSAPENMWQCQTTNCGYIYDPDRGDRKGKIPAGTSFEDLPEGWKCPICGGGKKCFRPLAGPGSTKEVKCPV
jgi:rubredoxin